MTGRIIHTFHGVRCEIYKARLPFGPLVWVGEFRGSDGRLLWSKLPEEKDRTPCVLVAADTDLGLQDLLRRMEIRIRLSVPYTRKKKGRRIDLPTIDKVRSIA